MNAATVRLSILLLCLVVACAPEDSSSLAPKSSPTLTQASALPTPPASSGEASHPSCTIVLDHLKSHFRTASLLSTFAIAGAERTCLYSTPTARVAVVLHNGGDRTWYEDQVRAHEERSQFAVPGGDGFFSLADTVATRMGRGVLINAPRLDEQPKLAVEILGSDAFGSL